MKFKLESAVFEEKAVERSFSRDFRADIFKEEIRVFDSAHISGTVRYLQLDRFCLIIQDLLVPEGYSMNICGNSNLFKLHFELEGNYSYTPANATVPVVTIPGNHFNLFYYSKPEGILDFSTTARRSLEVLFTEDFIKKATGDEYSTQMKSLSNRIKKKQPFPLWQESRPISPELQQNIREIIGCRYCGHIKKIYLEARITALLVSFLADTSGGFDQEEKEILKSDYAGIQRVEEHIRKNFQENITIAELAPIAGLNTSKLKQSFKKIYCTTIFKYITRLRMERARELIRNEQMSVSEASYQVGYKNPQHFTVAFKKYYGFLPSSLSGVN